MGFFKMIKDFNYKLFFTLNLILLLPMIYTTTRIFFLGNLPSDWGVNIASQLTWVNLVFESTQEALILPLFFMIGKSLGNKQELENKIKTGSITSFIIYFIISLILFIFLNPLLNFASQKSNIIGASADYIKLELIAATIGILYKFISIFFISLGNIKNLITLLFCKLILILMFDTFLISSLSFSKNIGVNGIAVSNIISNMILFFLSIWLLKRNGIQVFSRQKMSFLWLKEWFKIGSLSGIESIVRNTAFFIMILKMINVVEKQGDFWIANNFIWGWLLLPILALGDLIKKEISEDSNKIINVSKYICITSIILFIWIITIPFWDDFLVKFMNVKQPNNILHIIMISLMFYIIFAFNNIFDSIFYGLGRTDLMLKQSLIVNIFFYGTMAFLFKINYFIPTLDKIVLMFGTGILIDSIITFYLFIKLKEKSAIYCVVK